MEKGEKKRAEPETLKTRRWRIEGGGWRRRNGERRRGWRVEDGGWRRQRRRGWRIEGGRRRDRRRRGGRLLGKGWPGSAGELGEGGERRPSGGAFVPGQVGRVDRAGKEAIAHLGFGVRPDRAAVMVDEKLHEG